MSHVNIQELFAAGQEGNARAFADMAALAIAAGKAGELSRSDALVHAMVWSRFAMAVNPDAATLNNAADVLASYALDTCERGFLAHAIEIGAQALHRYEQAALLGSDNASTQMNVIADLLPAQASQLAAMWGRNGHAEIVSEEDACLRAAAGGDVQAIGTLFDIAADTASAGCMSDEDAMAILQVVGSLANATGEPSLVSRYAGVLLMRGSYMRALFGGAGQFWLYEAEAIHMLYGLVEAGAAIGEPHLKIAISASDPRALAAVAKDCPGVLSVLDCKGAC